MQQRINITMPIDLIRDLRRNIPEKSRSGYITKLVQKDLKRKKSLKRDLIRSLKASRKLDKQIMEDFKYADAETLKYIP